jgi:hypothetical protein
MATATATRTAANGPAAPAPSRMTLASVRRDVGPRPDRILLMGTEGVGKTTFAAEAPSPIFICAEDGIPTALQHIPRFPEPQSFAEVLEAIRTLARDEHDFRTLAVDTLDWLEPLIWRDLCARNGWTADDGAPDIEKPGYGKGYVAAAEEWRRFFAALDQLRNRRGMEIILLAHTEIKTFQNPAGNDYSRYQLKLHKTSAGLVKEWTDVNLFAIHEEFAKEIKGKPTRKGFSTGRRVVHTERTAAWDAKNRHSLPPELPLNYADYAAARAAGVPADPSALLEEGLALIAQLAIDDVKKNETREWLRNQHAKGAAVLARAVDRLRSKVAEMEGGQ